MLANVDSAALQRLTASPLLYNLTPRELDAIAQSVTVLGAPPGTVVIREGQVGDSLFIVGRGNLQVMMCAPTGENVVVGTLAEGDSFGEISLIDKAPRSATIATVDDCMLYVLTHAALYAFARSHRDGFTWFMVNVARGLARKLQESSRQLAARGTL